MQLKDATDLERRVYEQCLAVEEMPASPEQTALSATLSEAGQRLQTLRADNAELKDRQKTLIEVFIHDPRQWDTEEAGGTATVLACLLLEKVREFIKNYGHDPKGNVEDALAAITAENAELKRQVVTLRDEAEVGALVKELLKDAGHINFVAQDARGCYVQRRKKSGGWLPEHFGANILEALREAAKEVPSCE